MNKNKKKQGRILCCIFVICLLFIAGCSMEKTDSRWTDSQNGEKTGLTVHYIDVGQGSSALIEADGHFMLVDAGEREQGTVVVDYLREQNVTELEYVIGTHPHSDHIGGMTEVLKNFQTDILMIPEKEHTTVTFEKMLEKAEEKKVDIVFPEQGESYNLGDASFTILSLNKDYQDELNNWSIVFRLDYKDTSFLFSGDAEEEAEQDIYKTGQDLKTDVYLVGHHGSDTSTSSEFLKAVSPKYAVISCGADNSYGHPKPQTIKHLEDADIQVFRTDLQGDIILHSDGTDITWNVKTEKTSAAETIYILNTKTKKFHLPSCSSVAQTKEENKKEFAGTKEELIEQGYEACKNCNP